MFKAGEAERKIYIHRKKDFKIWTIVELLKNMDEEQKADILRKAEEG